MNKQEMKQVIHEEFGFSKNKIVIDEGSQWDTGEFEYIIFSVCGIKYVMNYSSIEQHYILHVRKSYGRIE